MSNEVTIRDVGPGDAAELARLLTEFSGLDTSEAQAAARLARSRGIEIAVFAELGGGVAGFASLRLLPYLGEEAPWAELSDLYVRQAHRGRGVARSLVDALEARARAAGASHWSVVASADNEAALALYRGSGFEDHAIALHKWFGDERPYREPDS
jgi:ribosomal protein S18 acetylase RimI-like enzyme